MDADTREMYWMGITMIEARNALVNMNVSAYPHLKKESQDRLHRSMYDMAHPLPESTIGKPLDLEQVAKALGAALNG